MRKLCYLESGWEEKLQKRAAGYAKKLEIVIRMLWGWLGGIQAILEAVERQSSEFWFQENISRLENNLDGLESKKEDLS